MILYKKLFRDLFEHKGSNIATIIIIMMAVMLFSGASRVMNDISSSKDTFYAECNFPDAYAKVISAPCNFKDKIGKIHGIKDFEGRKTQDYTILDTNKTVRLVSETQNIGKYEIIEGREPREKDHEFLIGKAFAEKNNYKIGDTLSLVHKGSVVKLKISGFARSAENIFEMKDETTLFNDHTDFVVGFIPLETMQDISSDSFDEILFDFERGVQFEDVRNAIDKEFQPYGLISVYPQEDQTSEVVVAGEIKEMKTTMVLMPIVFFMVSALVMTIMIKRIISQQRGQIGILKAFGYSDSEVGMHYAMYCVVLGVVGGVLGGMVAMPMSEKFLAIYIDMFDMNFIVQYPDIKYILEGALLSSVFCALVGIKVSKNAMKIQPADAMRPEVPISGEKSFVEQYKAFSWIFNSSGKMAVRNIVRNRKRSFFIIIGLAFAFAISVLPWSLLEMMDSIVLDRYKYVEKYDAKMITSALNSKDDSLAEMRQFQGVSSAEAMLSVPSKLKHGGIEESVGILGLESDSNLYKIVDSDNKPVHLKDTGIMLSSRIAEKLNVKVGDNLIFTSPYSKFRTDEIKIPVTGVIKQLVGMNGYMDIDYLSEVLDYREVCNTVLLTTDSETVVDNIADKYNDSAKIKAVISKQSIVDQVIKRMEGTYGSLYGMGVIAVLMCFAIVYNIYLVVILERKREFATLMILGMPEKEVLSIVALEQWLLAILGIVLGVPLTKLMMIFFSKNLSSDMFTVPDDIKLTSLLLALALMVFSIYVAKILAGKKINKIDIAESLKAAE